MQKPIWDQYKEGSQLSVSAAENDLDETSARKSTLEGGIRTDITSMKFCRIPLSNGFLERT